MNNLPLYVLRDIIFSIDDEDDMLNFCKTNKQMQTQYNIIKDQWYKTHTTTIYIKNAYNQDVEVVTIGNKNTVTTWENGSITSTEQYKDEKKEGIWKIFSNGVLISKVSFKNDENHGSDKRWYASGQKMSIYIYKNGKLNGKSSEWDEDGKLLSKGKYKNGLMTGLWKINYNDIKSTGRFKPGQYYSTREGKFTTYFVNSDTIHKIEKFKNDKLNGIYKEFYEDGEKRKKGKYLNNKKDGTWIEWLENGNRKCKKEYKYGKLEGTWDLWWENNY
mgnify:CR=1 FL=1